MRCPVCDSLKFVFAFRTGGQTLTKCTGCGVLSREVPAGSVRSRPALGEGIAVYTGLLRQEMAHRNVSGEAMVQGADDSSAHRVKGGIAYTDDILGAEDPLAVLRALRSGMEQGSVLLFAASPIDFGPLRLPLPSWPHWSSGNRFFMRREHLHQMLLRAGFGEVWMARQKLAGTSPIAPMRKSPLAKRMMQSAIRLGHQTGLIGSREPLSATAVISAVAKAQPVVEKLSIVMPVYNERATFQQSLAAVLGKALPGIEKEIIIVESGSTDGTAEMVRALAGNPGVRLIFQPEPRGKGNAVREGLRAATGTVVLIQDADLEYDVDDYNALLQPILANEAIFVLGTRHQGDWKMRVFTDEPLTALAFNIGHIFFTSVLNLLLRERMTDPFTMFKVFRRDALHELQFVCNRFDFDHELVIKLVRKGYHPREIPVNYVARSFSEGKKVSVVRDGLTWLWIDLKLRLGPIGPRDH